MTKRISGTFGGIQFPDSLLAAQETGRLVVFAGAGVSVPWPSCLPNFGGLVENIGEGHDIQRQNEPYDHYLGKLHSHGVNVHQRAYDILNKSGLHRGLHEDILRLFNGSNLVRLVTTNFDGHFSAASKVVFPDAVVDEYCAPALPLGSNFNGIVYLHGRLNLFKQGLVLTDADFGRAYVTEGWSRRFLISLFQNFTVLFVGYSHEDPIMHHLARGVAQNREREEGRTGEFVARRFSLIGDDDKSEKWEHLGIEPIVYQVESGDGQDERFNQHHSLDTAINRWVTHCRRSNVDRVSRLKGFAEDPMKVVDPDVATEVQEALREPFLAKEFLQAAKSVEWLDWFEQQGLIAELFEVGAESHREDHPSLRYLANWFAEQFKLNHPQALRACCQHGGRLHSELVWRLFISIAYGPPEHVPDEIFESGGWLLLQQPEASLRAESWGNVLGRCKIPQHQVLALEIFRRLTQPKLELAEEFLFFDEDPQAQKAIFRLVLPGLHEAGLHNWVDNILRNHLNIFSEGLGHILGCHLGQASNLSARTHPDDEVYLDDYIGYGSHHRGDDDLLLILAQRLLEELGVKDSDSAIPLIKQWGKSRYFVLNRLALHGLEYLNAWTADQKVNWAIQCSADKLEALQNSVWSLLEVLWKDVSNDYRSLVVNWLLDSPVGLASELHSRRLCALFCALEKVGQATSLTEAKGKIIESWPRIKTLEDESVIAGPPKPNVMVRALQSTGEEWVEVIIQEADKIDYHHSDERQSSEVLLISGKENLEWHLDFLEAAVQRHDFPDIALNYWFSGWRESSPDATHWQKFFDLVHGTEKFSFEFWKGTAGLLLRGVERKEGRMPDELLSRASAVALRTWPHLEKDFSEHWGEYKQHDWLFLVLNRAPGDIARFWLFWIARLAGDADKSLAYDQIVAMSKSRSDSGTLAQIAFCWHCRMLYNRAPEIVLEHVLPLLEWQSDEITAWRCWGGFLQDNWHQDYIPIVIPDFEELVRREANKQDGFNRGVVGWVVFLVFFYVESSEKANWLLKLIGLMSDQMRVRAAEIMGRRLIECSSAEVDDAWVSWMKEYLVSRKTGVPIPFLEAEAIEVVYFPASMNNEFPHVSEWVMRELGSLLNGRVAIRPTPIIKTINQKNQALRFADNTCQFITWLMEHSRVIPRVADDTEVFKLKEDLKANGVSQKLLEKLENALVPFS